MSDDLNAVLNDEEPTEDDVTTPEQPEPEAKAEEPEQPEPAEKMVPLSALMAERHERQAREDYWRGIAERNAAQQPKAEAERYDVLANPDGLDAYVDQKIGRKFTEVKTDLSRAYAERAFGREALSEAVNWANGNQSVINAALASNDPYGHIVDAYKREKVLTQTGGDLDAFLARERAKWEAEANARKVVDDAKGRPPASLAGDTSIGARGGGDGPLTNDDLKALIG